MTLSELLAKRVAETGRNQAAYARIIGVTPQTLNHMLQGNIKVPNPDLRRRIARDLGLRHVDLLVLLGELSDDEIAAVASRWPTDDERRVRAFGIVESLPDAALDYTLRALGMIRNDRW